MRDASANQYATTRNTLESEVCLSGVMTETRVSRRSNLDMGEAGNGRSDTAMDVAMDMVMVATPVSTETAGATIV